MGVLSFRLINYLALHTGLPAGTPSSRYRNAVQTISDPRRPIATIDIGAKTTILCQQSVLSDSTLTAFPRDGQTPFPYNLID